METPIVHAALEEGLEAHQRLYAHRDYFDYVIPASWFLMGVAGFAFYFYRDVVDGAIKWMKALLHQVGEPTTAMDILAAIILLVVAFNVTYILGHVLNGFAAAVLERVFVRKLLRFPFQLYELKSKDKRKNRNDGERFRDAVLDNPYQVHCANLLPLLFFEVTLLTFARVNPHAGSWVDHHRAATFLLALGAVVAHFGIPHWVPSSRYAARFRDVIGLFRWFFWCHIVVLLLIGAIVGWAIAYQGTASVLVVLPLTNLLLALIDRRLRRQGRGRHRRVFVRCLYFYLTLTFVNFAYFGAKLVGYSAAPSRDLIARASRFVGYNSQENDFFWMTHLRVQKEAPTLYATVYHAMSLQGMNRNLSNATAFILAVSVGAFAIKWPEPFRYSALVWIAALAGLSYLFFVRYLFLFSGPHSRYILRAAALLAENEPMQSPLSGSSGA